MPPQRIPIALDEEQIRELASLGLTDAKIAALARVSERTLQRRYGAILKEGRIMTERNLRRALIEQALNGNNTTALIFACKAVAKMREYERDETTAVRIEIIEAAQNELRDVIDAAAEDMAEEAHE